MKRFNYSPGLDGGMYESAAGQYVKHGHVLRLVGGLRKANTEIGGLRRQLADAEADKKTLHEGLRDSYFKIGELQRRLAAREDELAHLVHPFDLEKYRKSK